MSDEYKKDLAQLFALDKSEDVFIIINNKTQIKLAKEKLQEYDFVYIERLVNNPTYRSYKDNPDKLYESEVLYDVYFTNYFRVFR